ncbi:MAG TPA: serine/threonine-protein kinase [Candidatus Methylacidiphilales bacterium]|nr:serine/threonine-protein kinase [Candidatus Methylacidiphilales bacterium]
MPPLIRKIEPGDVIGRCRIIRELGRGGVGTVYLADHQTLRIEVAIKILSPALSLDNPALGERFIREAQLAASIRHANVIAVMDAALDEPSGAYYIVMEYISGGSLAWHLRHGPLPEMKALGVVAGIAQALIAAEDGRIVHRDIKPENILLDPRGTPKLADLGLAKNVIDTHASITLGGSFMGTPAYMSPEQARDAKVADTRDDIYSLGATFYECLTGVPPFQGETPYNIMSELLTKPSPRPRDVRPELHGATDLVCRKMMAKSRDLRYGCARDLLRDLQIVQMYGDREREQLIAADFEREADEARQAELRRESKYGIATSSEGAYAEPMELADAPEPDVPVFPPPRRNRDVFGAAAMLIALVIVTTLFFAWAGPNHPLAALERKFAELTGEPLTAPPVAPKPKATKLKEHHEHEHVAASKPETHESTPKPAPATHEETQPATTAATSTNTPAPFAAVSTVPVALPVEPAGDTNAVPAIPVNPNDLGPPAPVATFSAFAARDIAERSLDPDLVTPSGHAELLRIKGERNPASVTPTTWVFYFYDKNAGGHARIVTVTDGRVVKSGDDVVDSLTPYDEDLVMPEGQVQKDSTDVLAVAQAQVPDATATGSEFLLMQQKNSVPMWKVTLWGKTAGGDERKLSETTLLAETGTPIRVVK